MPSICNSRLLIVVAVMCLVGGVLAQTADPTTPNPCPSITPPVLVSFSAERVLDPAQLLSALPPIFPAALATAVQNKAVEIHEAIAFSNQNQVLTLNLFRAQTGAPLPTPLNSLAPGAILSILAMKVDRIYTSCTPGTSLMFAGTIATNTPPGLYGNLSGAPAAVSVGLTNDSSPKIPNVVVLVAGTSVAFSAAGAGTITFAASPMVTPFESNEKPSIVLDVLQLTSLPYVTLDASASTGNNLPLTFEWSVVAGAADIGNAKAAK